MSFETHKRFVCACVWNKGRHFKELFHSLFS